MAKCPVPKKIPEGSSYEGPRERCYAKRGPCFESFVDSPTPKSLLPITSQRNSAPLCRLSPPT